MTWTGVTSMEPDWLVSQGWSVLGLRELVACGQQCTSKMDLEYLFPSVEPPTSRYRQEKSRVWSEHICINTYQTGDPKVTTEKQKEGYCNHLCAEEDLKANRKTYMYD